MKVLIELGHPAHFHLYKNIIYNLKNNGNEVFVLIKTKDILQELLEKEGIQYYNILPGGRKDSKLNILWGIIIRDWRIFWFTLKHKIDLLTGSSPHVAHIGWLLNRYSVVTGEDDDVVVPAFGKLTHPFAKEYLSPRVCNNGKFDSKSVKYESYHELAYLHPNHFTPDKRIVEKYFSAEKPYFILRFAKLKAYHDDNIQGINTEIAQHIIDILKPHGDIYITAERELEPQFEPYRIKINPLDMHHVMAFAQIYIGDSQTMAAEAGVLGIPFVRFNDFVGRIGYLRELEDNYKLGFGVKTTEIHRLYQVIQDLIDMPDRKNIFQERRIKMLSEKIDYAKFLTWFIENYPESGKIMRDNPDYQFNFK